MITNADSALKRCLEAERLGPDEWQRRRAQQGLKRLNAILVIADLSTSVQQVLAKSMVLARHFGASLELFFCDSEHAYALKHAYDREGIELARQRCLSNARTYLEALRRSIIAEDVPVSIDVDCKSPLYESVVHKVLTSNPDLVIRGVAGEQNQARCRLDTNDWELARTCPVPLMLTCGRPWRARPTFAAAVDLFADKSVSMAHTIMCAAQFLAQGCHAELDAVYSELRPDQGATSRAMLMSEIGAQAGLATDHLHMLSGDPQITLSAFAIERHYDMVVLGALGHDRAPATLVGTLTSKLVESLSCDFVLVRPGNAIALD